MSAAATSPTPKRAVAYVRVSTGEQTVENQKMQIRQWAVTFGYEVIQFFEEPGISGKYHALERPVFREMVDALPALKPEAILVYEISRVGRNMYDSIEAIKAVEQIAPIVCTSPKEQFLQTTDTQSRKLLIGILTWSAERERELLIQRTRDGMARARESGHYPGRPKREINPEVYLKLLAQGKSTRKIAKELGCGATTLRMRLAELQEYAETKHALKSLGESMAATAAPEAQL